jgi:hypothetical protein
MALKNVMNLNVSNIGTHRCSTWTVFDRNHTGAARLNVDERHGSMPWLYGIDMDGNPVREPVEEDTASRA